MADRRELDRLIEAALADNKITSKEKEVLIKKAKQLGIDEDEFIVELDAIKHLKNEKEKKSKTAKSTNWSEEFKNKTPKSILAGFMIFFCFIFLMMFLASLPELIQDLNFNRTEKKFQTALAKYDFQKAFILLSEFKDDVFVEGFSERAIRNQQLLKTAVPFFLKNNEAQSAIAILNEYQFKRTMPQSSTYSTMTSNSEKDQTQKWDQEKYNNEVRLINSLWFDIAFYLVKNGRVDEGEDIIKFKLVSYVDSKNRPTFEPMKELKNSFQELIKNLPKSAN